MGYAVIACRAQHGMRARRVSVEVYLSGGLPAVSIVGLADTAVRESRDRVRGAIESSGFRTPQERTVVSLAPADMRKTGNRFDLAIALGILAASGQVNQKAVGSCECYGELGLNGELRSVTGILPSALQAAADGVPVIVPAGNLQEALVAGARVYPANTLAEVVSHLNGRYAIEPADPLTRPTSGPARFPDLADVRGQPRARRALEIAAAGGHNLLLCGPPGTGKSMLARRLSGLLPEPSLAEALESAAIVSILGRELDPETLVTRPFRSPHHTASAPALVGGGSEPSPGEVSLAHNGVLFLDELPEFDRNVLEVLREPMETGVITISRAGSRADFPARFQFIGAMNPCPCGFLGDPAANCRCSLDRVERYRAKISGPLLDRIDMHVEVPRPPKECLRPNAPLGENSQTVRLRVQAAMSRQVNRQGQANATLTGQRLHEVCAAGDEAWKLLEQAVDRFAMSARAHQRIWRLARTIADLAEAGSVSRRHASEALTFRYRDAMGR